MAKFEDDMTLRMITYLSPGLPISLFQSIQYYIEERLGRSTYLMMESRASGPLDDRKDPFTTDHVDIGKSIYLLIGVLHYCQHPCVIFDAIASPK